LIIHNATIHSPVERFATALHVEEETIVWMGDEDTARYRAAAHPQAALLDADGALITPAFHLAHRLDARADFPRQGISAVHARVRDAAELTDLRRHVDATAILTTGAPGPGAIRLLPSGASAAEMTEFLTDPGGPAGVEVGTPADLRAFSTLERRGRVYLSSTLAVTPAALQGWEVIVIMEGAVRLNLAELAGAGVPYALAGEEDPWTLLTRALTEGPGPVSARAAFTALTRGPWRLTPGQGAPRGVLRVGAAADFAVWEVEALAVQAPSEATSFWSTDQRAGTPLLPALGEGETPPRLRALYRAGRRTFEGT